MPRTRKFDPNAIMNPNPVPVVVGGSVNSLTAVRSLARAGLRPILVSCVDGPGTASKYARIFKVPTYSKESLIDNLIHLKTQLPNGAVLICVEDTPAITVSRYRERLAPHFNLPKLPPHEQYVEIGLKDHFFQMAQKGGFPVPSTLLLKSLDDVESVKDLRLPLCVKPNIHTVAYDRSFKKAYRVDSYSEAQSLCEDILNAAGEVLVQEWIEGSNDSIYFALCYMVDPKPVVFVGRKGRSWPPQIGVTASCWAAPEVADELEEMTVRFFRSVGFTHGFASMEYKRDSRDSRFRMVEPTIGRTNGQVEIAALCGINLCYAAYCDAAQLPLPAPNLDPKHVWRDEFTDFISARILGQSCSYPPGYKVHNAYMRWDDPGPGFFALKDLSRRMLLRARRAISGETAWSDLLSYTRHGKA